MTRSQHEGMMPAPTFTPHRVNVTAADTAAPYDGIEASLDLGTAAAGNLDTIVRARVAGVAGDAITVAATGNRTDGTVVVTEVGTAVTIAYDDDVSTVADVEAAIDAQSTLIEVATAGTGATVLDAATDDFVATPLTGGVNSIPKLHGFDASGYEDVVAQVKLDGSDLDINVLIWSDLANAFVDQSPAVAFSNLAASKLIRFSVGGQRFFIHCAGTFTRVDIDCAGAESAV